MLGWLTKPIDLVTADRALPGRSTALQTAVNHVVLGTPMHGPHPADTASLWLGLGCFWGAERLLWKLPGVVTTAVGYAGGHTPNPSYEEVCTGKTAHTEVVLVVYRPTALSHLEMMRVFLESHDPTQGMRQGNDAGTQYRSAVYWALPEQRDAFEALRSPYQALLQQKGHGAITTELRGQADLTGFYFAEDYHQQYLHKNPAGYCGIGGTGVSCPVPAR
jgi:peptide-methionine (S)-S-oxide reductase